MPYTNHDAHGRSHRKRGRPSKFGRPSQLVAVTLPAEVVRGLRGMHPDLAWAIVSMFEAASADTTRGNGARPEQHEQTELVHIGDSNCLIIVNTATVKKLPGVEIVPMGDGRAFLALEPGCGLADLETAVLDRFGVTERGTAERRALDHFRRQIRDWRQDKGLKFHTRAIIVAERVRSPRTRAKSTLDRAHRRPAS